MVEVPLKPRRSSNRIAAVRENISALIEQAAVYFRRGGRGELTSERSQNRKL